MLIASAPMQATPNRLFFGASTIVAAFLVGAPGCLTEANPGVEPPSDQMFFPAGLALDPRTSSEPGPPCEQDADCGTGSACAVGECLEKSAWLYVANANSDLRYNAGTLIAVDIDAFLGRALSSDVLGPGAETDPDGASRACRREATIPQMIECTEEPFIASDATVRTGNFAAMLTGWHRPAEMDKAEKSLLLAPVRGDPSISYFELKGGLGQGGGRLRLECGQGKGSRDCGDAYRLSHARNDPDAAPLAAEPSYVAISRPGTEPQLAYVTHSGRRDLTLINLEGLKLGGVDRPTIVDQAPLLYFSTLDIIPGGYGVAERPCDPDNAPNLTLGCTRPLVYAGFRFSRHVAAFTAVGLDVPAPDDGYTCVGPDEVGDPGAVVCEERVVSERIFFAGGLSHPIAPGDFSPRLGVLGFSKDGNDLYMAQTVPSALIRIDTSVVDGEPRELPTGEVEVCPRPTALAVYEDSQGRYGMVTCYRTASMFVADLHAMEVVATVRVGTGPHHMLVDYARQYVYVANTLDATISVVDFSPERETRFTEVARLGIQDPYST